MKIAYTDNTKEKEGIEPMVQPKDIANAFVFPASEEASYITGVVLRVDGIARV